MMPFMTQPAVAPACYVPSYKVAQSQLFKGGQRLSRAITVTGNRQTFAFRTLVTRGTPGTPQTLYNVDYPNNAPCTHIVIDGDDRLYLRHTAGGVANIFEIKSNALLRSPGFYDVLAIVDTNAEAESDYLQLYLNGVRIRSFYSAIYPTPGWPGGDANLAGGTDLLGAYGNRGSYSQYADGLFADTVWLDGTVPAVTDFGAFNIHGVWVPKRPAFALDQYGPNGWFLDFSDPLNPGKDVSGKGNHWTAEGFDVSGKDSVASTPTNVYATLNPLAEWPSNVAVSNGGLTATGVSTTDSGNGVATLAANVPIYFEARLDVVNSQSTGVGLVKTVFPPHSGAVDGVATWWVGLNKIRDAKGNVVGSLSGVSGDVAMVAYDPVLGYVWFGKNGTWLNDGKPDAGTNPSVKDVPSGARPRVNVVALGSASQITVNFGQRPFAYAPPVGFKTLCTDNLPEPDIKDPSEAFVQVAATGADMDGALTALTAHWNGVPYVEIVKRRDVSEDWRVRFSDDPGHAWATNNALAKAAAPALVAAGDYVGYRLRVGARYGVYTAEVEHTEGTATTVTHGLNTARAVVIATRVSAGGGDRYVWHPDMTAGVLGKLNRNTQPTADGTLTAFGAASFQIASAAPSGTYRVLVLAHRPGWLEIGSYKGNGSADGAYDAMGIVPLWQLIKRLDNSGAWMQSDTAHAPTNPMVTHFDMDKPNSEINAGYDLDMVVGGVKYRTAGYSSNDAGGTYLRIAIGRPVGGICVAPATAR